MILQVVPIANEGLDNNEKIQMMMTFPRVVGGARSPDVGWGGALVRGWGGPNALYRPAGGCTALLEPAIELVLC